MIDITTIDINGFFAMISAVLLLIITWYNKQRTEAALTTAQSTSSTAKTNAALVAAATATFTPATPATSGAGFLLPRDGKYIAAGLDGWNVRINPSPEAATLPDDKAYQAVSPGGALWSGDMTTVLYLVSSPDAAGWRAKFK